MTYKQIRITQSTYEQLTEIKEDEDSYSQAIRRLIVENKSMRDHIEELKQDKNNLMKIAMKTPDSIAFPQIAHYVNFALIEVLKDKDTSAEDKLSSLKTYLKPSLDKDVHEVLYYIEEFKQDNEDFETILNDLSSWIKYTYRLN